MAACGVVKCTIEAGRGAACTTLDGVGAWAVGAGAAVARTGAAGTAAGSAETIEWCGASAARAPQALSPAPSAARARAVTASRVGEQFMIASLGGPRMS